MNDKQKQLLALADELKERHGRCAQSITHGDAYVVHSSGRTRNVGVAIHRVDDSLAAAVCLTPSDAIRWGESLAAAGRVAQK